MNEIQAGNLAFENHTKIVNYKKFIVGGVLHLAQALEENKNSNFYLQLGYDDWKTYIASPEISLSEGYVSKICKCYKVFIEQYHVEKEVLINVDIEKLYLITPMIKTEADIEEWVEKAKTLSRSDLMLEVKDNGEECEHDFVSYQICKHCQLRRKIEP